MNATYEFLNCVTQAVSVSSKNKEWKEEDYVA